MKGTKKKQGAKHELFPENTIKNYYKQYANEYQALKFVYIFDNGSVVYWNFTEEEEHAVNAGLLLRIDKKSEVINNEYLYLEKNFYEDDA